MHILIIHQYFLTPETGGAIRSYFLAKGLSAQGHKISIITSGNRKRYEVTNIDDIEVHYLPVSYHNRFSKRQRIVSFLRYTWFCTLMAPKIKNVDLVYVISSPLTVGFPALWLNIFYSKPFVFEVGDLWPQAPIEFGVIKNLFIKKFLYSFENKVYKSAWKIVALSPPIKDYILNKVPEAEVEVIPNMADINFYNSVSCDFPTDMNNPFVISYFGAISEANNIEDIILLAVQQPKENNIIFQIMGDGKDAEKIKEMAKDYGLAKVIFFPFGNRDEVLEKMNASQAIIITYKDLPVLSTGSPNKLFDGLAAGKLIIINFKGWIKELIESNKCGYQYLVGDAEDFNRKIKPFLTDQDLLKTFQENARKLAEEKFSKERLIRKLGNFINV
ncbi:MAG: glycosyltransferase family 4 protein [Bacteroidetes bacterium]|nr:glycosyltransferase family 4 protein [Bacteroidota bacterium]